MIWNDWFIAELWHVHDLTDFKIVLFSLATEPNRSEPVLPVPTNFDELDDYPEPSIFDDFDEHDEATFLRCKLSLQVFMSHFSH